MGIIEILQKVFSWITRLTFHLCGVCVKISKKLKVLKQLKIQVEDESSSERSDK